MTFKPALWHPISVALSGINLAAAGFAAASSEPIHATVHVGVALAFGWWARRLRQAPAAGGDAQERLELLDDEVTELRRELSEAQERLDFTERMLAQGAEARRVDPER